MATDEQIAIAEDSKLGGVHSVGVVETQSWTLDAPPLALDCGRTLGPITQAYETYGTLSPARAARQSSASMADG